MSIETYQFNLPITPGAIPPVLHLSQYDSGRTFTAILRDDANVPFELDSGATAVIKGRNAAGIAWQQDCTVSGANVTFTPSGAATDQFGVMPVTIEITESEEVISPLCVVFHIQKAGYTNEEAVLSPDFETAIEAAVAQAIAEGGLGFSDEFKEALLACFNGVAWATTGGQALVDDLEAALYPDVHLVSITAAYDQDRPIYDTDSLDLVKLDLVVTANYSDGTSETLADDAYTLTGTLVAPSSTITVGYGGKTAEVSVVVSYTYEWSLANGKLIKLVGSTSGNIQAIPGGIEYGSASTNRRSFPTTRVGVRALQDQANNYAFTDYYPIPIPPDAIKAKITIEPATQYHGESMYTYDPAVGYTRQADPGWKQGSFTHTFTAGAYDYITVASKYNSAGTSYPTEPTVLKVEFLTE